MENATAFYLVGLTVRIVGSLGVLALMIYAVFTLIFVAAGYGLLLLAGAFLAAFVVNFLSIAFFGAGLWFSRDRG
jgi:hypothetical protein